MSASNPFDPENLRVFGLGRSKLFAERVADAAGVPLAEHEEREFEDGEHKARPLVSVRDRDVYVVHSLYGEPGASPNDKLCRLLFFLGAVRDAGAHRVTAVVPYLCYGRKDRRTKARDPLTTRYVAQMFESVGVDRVVTVEAHNLQALENAFRCRVEHLEVRGVLARHVAQAVGEAPAVVVSPDVGGAKRAEGFRERLERETGRRIPSAFVEKKRSEGVVSGDLLVGDVRDRAAVLVDDMIGTGTTLQRAARACRAAGARSVQAVAAHGLFLEGAAKVLADPSLDGVVVADTVPPFRIEGDPSLAKVTVLSLAPLVGEAVRRLHSGGSLVELAEA
jgi:ribose-phosphate pyrophosphokinase